MQLCGVEARIANSKIEQVFKAEFVPIEISYHEINSYQNKSTQYIVRITDTINHISISWSLTAALAIYQLHSS